MANQSLFRASKMIIKNMASGTQEIGGYNVPIEYFTQDTLNSGTFTLGNSTQDSVVLLAGDTITIPSGKTLTTTSPKKSLVIMCNTFTNNGTISMTTKSPNVTPHNWFIFGKTDGFLLRENATTGEIEGYGTNIIIPAYANNSISGWGSSVSDGAGKGVSGKNGNNGTNRNCGSGGVGLGWVRSGGSITAGSSGSGYAFGGGAGSGGVWYGNSSGSLVGNSVSSSTPMIPSAGIKAGGWTGMDSPTPNPKYGIGYGYGGCGGRIIIYCINFINNGSIVTNGTISYASSNRCPAGGASGAGAIDIFYSEKTSNGTLTAKGGSSTTYNSCTTGAGGNGSITFSQWSLDKVVKEQRKKFTQSNWEYLFSEYAQRIAEEQ